MYRGKRALDLAITAATAPLWLPLLGVVAAVVRAKMGPPVIFRQLRPGLGGRTFELMKFRTMRPRGSGADGEDDADRLTPFGRWLRASSLDELPELLNVLRGDMSLVGPRPLLPAYLSIYTPHHQRRHDARPGVTGLAQVSGRNALTWVQRLDLDVEYVERQSLRLDIAILGRTISAVVSRQGITGEGSATMHALAPGYATSAPRSPDAAP